MRYYNTTNSPIAIPDGEGSHFWFPALAPSVVTDQATIDKLIRVEPHLAFLIGSVLVQMDDGGPPVLTITSPEPGAVLPPVHDIVGTGAIPFATVELWHVEGNVMVASVPADAAGNFVFGGDTPASLGEVTWQVKSDGTVDQESAPVGITVVEEPPLDPPQTPQDAPAPEGGSGPDPVAAPEPGVKPGPWEVPQKEKGGKKGG